jgi:3-hydroxyisobutyrate dehydrogenase-like beta-hydroxyacid dehydrogenase
MPRPLASRRNNHDTGNGDLNMQVDGPVGIVGLGLLGAALSERLINAKIPVIGFDIEPTKCKNLTTLGGLVCTTAREVAERARTIVGAVYSGEQVEALFGELDTTSGPTSPIVICMTTCAPDEVARLAQRATGFGIPFVEAPISGTSAEVREGTAIALVAGETAVIDAAAVPLSIMCPRSIRVGKIGNASRAKLAINLILQSNRAALAEGIVFAECLGLDGQAFLKMARESAAYSRVMDSKGDKMLARDFQPQSHLSQTLKDAELILKEAQRHDLQLPMTLTQAGLLRTAIALAGPNSDSAAVIEAIRRQPNLTEDIR